MLYLYYFDGKLKNAPHKYPDSVGQVCVDNVWAHKIDATNGYTATTARFKTLQERSKTNTKDIHVLTNCLWLAENYKYIFIPNEQFSTWVLVKDKAELKGSR